MNSETPMAKWLESAWLARYLDRQLSDDETAWFEAYTLDKPHLLQSIELDTQLRDVLAASKVPLRAMPAATPAHSPTAAPPARRSRKFAMAGAAAVSVLVGLLLGRWSQKPLLLDGLIANPTRITIDTVRGSGETVHRDHANAKSPYLLVELALPSGAEHPTLYFGDRAPVALEQSSEGFVSFLVDRSLIAKTGNAEIRYGLNGQDGVRVIPVRTIR